MAERRWRLALAAALLGALVPLTGCGLSVDSAPVVVGAGPQLNDPNTRSSLATPAGPDDATDPRNLVDLYLQAAADRVEEAPKKLKAFLTPAAQASWRPGKAVTLVRLVGAAKESVSGDRIKLDYSLELVGTLDDKGRVIVDNAAGTSLVRSFTVVRYDDHWRIEDPPADLLLLDTALTKYFDVRPTYFWDTKGEVLVPDLHYMPHTISPDYRPTQMVQWLLDGASSWLDPAVAALPTGTKLNPNVVANGSRLVVNLTAPAAAGSLDRIATQLQWTLWPDHRGALELQVDGVPKVRAEAQSPAFLAANPAARFPAELLCVVNAAVRSTCPVIASRDDRTSARTRALPVLTSPDNSHVVTAAVSRDGASAALVRDTGNGVRTLWVRHLDREETGHSFVRTSVVGSSIGRPTWLGGTGRFYVVADGVLYEVSADGGSVRAVNVNGRRVSDVSVAPDGRRAALIIDDQVYLASLVEENSGRAIGKLVKIPVGLDRGIAVAWTSQTDLIVAGRRGRSELREISVDGAVVPNPPTYQSELDGYGVTALVAHPDDPVDQSRTAQVLVQTPERVYQVFSKRLDEVRIKLPTDATVSPAPSTGPGTGGGSGTAGVTTPTALFFVG